MTSESQKKRGYPLPEILEPEEYLCLTLKIPNSDEYVRAIRGAIQELGYWWNWQKTYTVGDTRAKTASEVWRKTIYETLEIGECAVCCCDDIAEIKNQVINIRNTINFNNTNVANYYTNYATKRDEYGASSDPVLDIAPDYMIATATTEPAICQALNEFIATSLQIVIENRERDQFFAGLLTVSLGIASAIATGGSSLALGLALGSAGAGLGGLFSGVAISVLEDQSARDEVKCLMFDRLKNVKPTIANFTASLATATGLSINAEILRATLEGLASNVDVHMGFLDRLNELYPLAQSGLLDDCETCGDLLTPYWALASGSVINQIDANNVELTPLPIPNGWQRLYSPTDAPVTVTYNSISATGACGIDVIVDGVLFYAGLLTGFNALLPVTGVIQCTIYNNVIVTINYDDV